MKEYDTPKYRIIETVTASAKHRPPLTNDMFLDRPLIFPHHDRRFSIGIKLFTGAVAAYLILFGNFGEHDHCFSSLRRYVFGKARSLMTVGPNDVGYIQRRVEEMEIKVAQVDEAKKQYSS